MHWLRRAFHVHLPFSRRLSIDPLFPRTIPTTTLKFSKYLRMSIPISGLCNHTCFSGSEGMTQATPHTISGVNVANGRQDVEQKSKIVKKAWSSELAGRVNTFRKSQEEFLDTIVPCSLPYQRPSTLSSPPHLKTSKGKRRSAPCPFAEYKPKAGEEIKSYAPLVRSNCPPTTPQGLSYAV